MHRLRIQPLACGRSSLKRLIAVLLLAPGLASASGPTCPAGSSCQLFITSGTGTFDDTGGSFTVAGPGWTSSVLFPGHFTQFESPVESGSFSLFWEDVSEGPPGQLTMSFTLGGVPWTAPDAGILGGPGHFGSATSFTVTNITHPGIYRAGSFGFFGTFAGVPASIGSCPPVGCTTWNFDSRGTALTVLLDVVAAQDGSLIADQATYIFSAPEPSTASLVLLGFAGLAGFRRYRRQSAAVEFDIQRVTLQSPLA
jgi:PEP-CTERM motif